MTHTVCQKVAQLLLSKSLSGEEVARLLVHVLSTKLGVLTMNVVAAMQDRASVNSVAMRTVCVLYNQTFDVGCLSHTLDHVGEKLDTPLVDEFFKSWDVQLKSENKVSLDLIDRTTFPIFLDHKMVE